MGQNILLTAILDTKKVETQLQNLSKTTGKYSAGMKHVGNPMLDKQLQQLTAIKQRQQELQSKLGGAKSTGIFGDPKAIKEVNAEYKKLEQLQTSLTNKVKQTAATFATLREKMQFGTSDKFRKKLTPDKIDSTLQQTVQRENELLKQQTILLAELEAKKKTQAFKGSFTGVSGFKEGIISGGQSKIKSDTADIKALKTQLRSLNVERDNLARQKTTIMNLKDLEKSTTKINKLNHGIAMTNTQMRKLGKESKAALSPMIVALNNLGIKGNSLSAIFGGLAGKVATWLIATTGIFMIIRGFKALVSEMKALEDATIKLQRVLPSAGKQLEDDTIAANKFAKAMSTLAAVTYGETLEALQNTVRAGFDLADSMTLARSAILAANVTELEAGEATKYMVASIRQFNLEATDSLWILNQWNELGKKTGATTKDIAEGVTRTGKAWQAAGGTFSQLNAIVAATVEATGQSGEKIGTMLKTVSARYSDLNRAQSVNNELSKHGIRVQLRNSTVQNGIFNVLQKVSKQWKSLTKEQQASLAKSFAGIRQYSKFIGVVDNFDNVIKALIVSIDSNNSAITENERRAKSLDFALKQLKGSFSELALSSTGLMSILKKSTYVLTDLLDGFNKIAANPIGNFLLTIIGSIVTTIALAAALTKGILVLGKAFKLLAADMAFGAAFTGPIGWIALAVGGITALTIALKGAKRAQNDLIGGTSTTIRAMMNSRRDLLESSEGMLNQYLDSKTTDKMKRQIAEMFKNVGNINLNDYLKVNGNRDEEFKKIKAAITELIGQRTALEMFKKELDKSDKNKNKVSYIDSVLGQTDKNSRNVIKDKIESITTYTKLIDKQNEKLKYAEDLKNKFATIRGRQATIKDIKRTIKELENGKLKDILKDLGFKDSVKAMTFLNALLDSFPEKLKALNTETKRLKFSADAIQASTKSMYTNIVDSILELKDGQTAMENLSNAFQSFGELVYNEMKNAIVTGMVDGMKEAMFLDEFKNTIRNSTEDVFRGAGEFLFRGESSDLKTKTSIPAGILNGQDGLLGLLGGAAAGSFTGAATGRDAGSSALTGGIGAIIGNLLAPGVGGSLIGGLIGGLFGGGKSEADKAEEAQEEQVKYARESAKELRMVNRNLTTLIDTQPNYQLQNESYYFSVSNARGLA